MTNEFDNKSSDPRPPHVGHPWRCSCPEGRAVRAAYSREWMRKHRPPFDLEKHRAYRARGKTRVQADTSRCLGCGVPLGEHELVWCRPRRAG